MAVANYDDFMAKLASPFQILSTLQVGGGGIATGKGRTQWMTHPVPGSAPTTGVVPAKDAAGSIDPYSRVTNPTLNAYIAEAEIGYRIGQNQGYVMIFDRLSHMGGLDATDVTAPNTTNFPTAALTRYTSGVGVMAALEIFVTIGTTATTVTCSYTNQDGTSGRTSQPIVVGVTNSSNGAGQLIPFGLQEGDYGVRSIESSTLAGTTGLAGNFGYTLYKPLAFIIGNAPFVTYHNMLLGGAGQISEVLDDACLCTFWAGGANSVPGWTGKLTLVEA